MAQILEHGALFLALLNFAFTLGAGAIGVYVRFSIAEMDVQIRKAIEAAGQEIDERIDRQSREFGETILALRTKITDVELYVRDTYVRRDSFAKAIDDLASGMRDMGLKIEKRLERMEEKIDKR